MVTEWRSKLPTLNAEDTNESKCPQSKVFNFDGTYSYYEMCRQPAVATSQAHCMVDQCHNTFRRVTHYEMHRYRGRCIDPGSLGLHKVDKIWDTWEGHELASATGKRLGETRHSRVSTNAPAA